MLCQIYVYIRSMGTQRAVVVKAVDRRKIREQAFIKLFPCARCCVRHITNSSSRSCLHSIYLHSP